MARYMNNKLSLQPYPREGLSLLSDPSIYPKKTPSISIPELNEAIDISFQRCLKNKMGVFKPYDPDPETLVASTVKHLKERSDPILSPYFLGLL